MDYEKAYKEALERAKKVHKYSSDLAEIKRMEHIFPELAESEDERIRKEFCKDIWTFIPNEKAHKYISWLEKQGQKPIDKIEPKFHEGEWITNGDYIWKIVEVKPLDYILQSQDGNIVDDTISHVDEQFHSFTIEDAKEGDMIVNGSNIFIFHFINDTRLMGYCHVNTDDGRFYDDIGKNECFCLIDAVVNPATKEQRDTLFAKMKEAGYEWDAKNKELNKIHIIDEGKAEMDHCFTKMMNGEKVSSTWSEEDEAKLKSACALIRNTRLNGNEGVVDSTIDWLKFLKQRIGG